MPHTEEKAPENRKTLSPKSLLPWAKCPFICQEKPAFSRYSELSKLANRQIQYHSLTFPNPYHRK